MEPVNFREPYRSLRKINYADPLWDEAAVIEALTRQHELLGLPVPAFHTVDSLPCLVEDFRPSSSSRWCGRIDGLTRQALRDDWQRVDNRRQWAFVRRFLQVVARNSVFESVGLDPWWSRVPYIRHVTEDVFRTLRAVRSSNQNDDVRRLIEVGMYMLEAVSNGLAYYGVTDDAFYLVPLPRMMFQDGVLHNEAGQAVEWQNGDGFYFLRGVEFSEDQHWRLMHGEFGPAQLADIHQADRRAIALSYFKPDALIGALDAKLIDTGKKGTRLYKTWLFPDVGIKDEAAYFMLMDDASTDRQFIEWVPPKVGSQGDAELCQAEAFGITLDEWLSIPAEQEG